MWEFFVFFLLIMLLFFFSYVSGLLTVLAPCVLPLVPAVLSGSLTGNGKAPLKRAGVIIISLMISILVFSIALRTTFALLPIGSESYLQWIAGGILIFLGLTFVFPQLWWSISRKLKFGESSQTQLLKAEQSESIFTPVLIGLAFGPVFSSCSPVYGVILAVILPESFLTGVVALFAYALGVGSLLFLIALLGQKLVHKLEWATDPRGVFRKIMGIVLMLIGLLYITGFDKVLEELTVNLGLGSTRIDLYFLEALGLR